MYRNQNTPRLNDDDVYACLARYKVSSSLEERLYATTDANHNVTSIDDVFGAVKERFVYDPYRNSTVLTSAFATTSDACQGQGKDAMTNTIDSRNRVFGLGIGRWMQADMARYVDGSNLYASNLNNPVRNLDPSGLAANLFDFGSDGWSGWYDLCDTTTSKTLYQRDKRTYVGNLQDLAPLYRILPDSIEAEAPIEREIAPGEMFYITVSFSDVKPPGNFDIEGYDLEFRDKTVLNITFKEKACARLTYSTTTYSRDDGNKKMAQTFKMEQLTKLELTCEANREVDWINTNQYRARLKRRNK